MSNTRETGGTPNNFDNTQARFFVIRIMKRNAQYEKDNAAFNNNQDRQLIKHDKWLKLFDKVQDNGDTEFMGLFGSLYFISEAADELTLLQQARRLEKKYEGVVLADEDGQHKEFEKKMKTSLTDVSLWNILTQRKSIAHSDPVGVSRFFLMHLDDKTIGQEVKRRRLSQGQAVHLAGLNLVMEHLPVIPPLIDQLKNKYPELTPDMTKDALNVREILLEAVKTTQSILFSPDHPKFAQAKALFEEFSLSDNYYQQYNFHRGLVGSLKFDSAWTNYRKANTFIEAGKEPKLYMNIKQLIAEINEEIMGEYVQLIAENHERRTEELTQHITQTQLDLSTLVKQSLLTETINPEALPFSLSEAVKSIEVQLKKQNKKINFTVSITATKGDGEVTIVVDTEKEGLDWNLIHTPEELPKLYDEVITIADASLDVVKEKIEAAQPRPTPVFEARDKSRKSKTHVRDDSYTLRKDMREERKAQAKAEDTQTPEAPPATEDTPQQLLYQNVEFDPAGYSPQVATQVNKAIEKWHNGQIQLTKLWKKRKGESDPQRFSLKVGKLLIVLSAEEPGTLKVIDVDTIQKINRKY